MKVLKYLFCTLLSFLLSATLICYLSLNIAKTITEKSFLDEVIGNTSMTELIKNEDGTYTEFGNELKENMVNAGVPETLVDEFVEAEPIEEFVVDYVDNTLGYVFEGEDYNHIEAKDIEKLINDNIDTIVADIREKGVEGADELTDERVESIKSQVSEFSQEIGDKIPNIENELNDEEVKTALKIARFFLSSSFNTLLLGIIAFICAILIVLNLRNCNFGYWIGIPFMLAGIPFAFVGLVLNAATITSNTEIVITLFEEVMARFLKDGLITFFIGLALLILACTFYTIQNKKRKQMNNNINNNSNNNSDLTTKEDEIVEKTEELIEKIEEVKNNPNVSNEKYCAYCGTKVLEEQQYCYGCGAEQNKS